MFLFTTETDLGLFPTSKVLGSLRVINESVPTIQGFERCLVMSGKEIHDPTVTHLDPLSAWWRLKLFPGSPMSSGGEENQSYLCSKVPLLLGSQLHFSLQAFRNFRAPSITLLPPGGWYDVIVSPFWTPRWNISPSLGTHLIYESQ